MDAPVARKILGALGTPRGKSGGKVSLTTTSAQSAALHSPDVAEPKGQQGWVDLISDTACFIEIGANPTAVVDTSYYMAAGVTYRFPVIRGDLVAGVLSASTGNLWWHEV